MLNFILTKIVGSKNERDLKRLKPYVDKTNSLEKEFLALSDHQLKSKTGEFKERISRGESLDNILFEAFACVREVSRRTLGMRHFDIQIMGGVVLHEGKIAEMATGEGKTLVATLPVYLNSLSGHGVHVITVNDYLARRDAEWMGPIYNFLGISVGVIQHGLDDVQRKNAYNADVTYGTNNEFGFDYLRDNMKFDLESCVQRELFYAIVDEVDSILIDEARTPLIISGPSEESTDKYYKIDKIIPRLRKELDYQIDEKSRTVSLSESGIAKSERYLGVDNLYDPSHIETLHHVNQALRAHTLFKKDVDYVVKDGEVIIVDEFTGRLMPGRRYSDGLHQALEAKEDVEIERENQTLASITFQNYFRMYKKLAGMTGTADTEAPEFAKIYNLDVVVVPTNQTLIRTNHPDVIYKTEREKFNSVVDEIASLYDKGRPVLVGTISIEKSERLSQFLKKKGIPHQVLNAKYHEKEAEIVAQAGRYKGVTIATNMAGRGTDILLGGNPVFLTKEEIRRQGKSGQISQEEYNKILEEMRVETQREHELVVSLGGLHITGTERHESRRIDNQLRGRSGRQGDPGSSRFYLSLEDDLLRIFGSERISSLMDKIGMEENQPIEHKLVSRAIETAQKRVEAHNFEIRKQLLEYDDVMNKQREVIYQQRREILEGGSQRDNIGDMIEDVLEQLLSLYVSEEQHPEDWDLKGLSEALYRQFDIRESFDNIDCKTISVTGLREDLMTKVLSRYERKEKEVGEEMMRHLERVILLQVIDTNWKDHLYSMDHLKEGIGLRGYGQKDPLTEYKREGFDIFSEMIDRIKEGALEYLFKMQLVREEMPSQESSDISLDFKKKKKEYQYSSTSSDHSEQKKSLKIGRNDPCPCGSGKKYKKCCLNK